jgi:hypothetical protein
MSYKWAGVAFDVNETVMWADASRGDNFGQVRDVLYDAAGERYLVRWYGPPMVDAWIPVEELRKRVLRSWTYGEVAGGGKP